MMRAPGGLQSHDGSESSPQFDLSSQRIWVAGHRGMVGGALIRKLALENCQVVTCERREVDLRRQTETETWIAANRPDAIILAAATVGGILANDTRPAEFLYDNLAIELNVIEAARQTGVKKILMLGSSCIYPRLADQPMAESALLTGPLEPTNQWYAIAKIAGVKLAQAYRRQYGLNAISAMPTNLYGPGDNFDPRSSHVVPALIRKIHDAKETGSPHVEVWGTGSPRREFMHVDDCADAALFLLRNYSGEEHVNIGVGHDLSIRELAESIARIVGYDGEFRYDRSQPDGAPRKLLDVSRLSAMGWTAHIDLEAGLRRTYQSYREKTIEPRTK